MGCVRNIRCHAGANGRHGTSSRSFRFYSAAFGWKTRAGLVTAARAHTRSGGLQAEDLGTGYFESGRFASILLRSDGRRGPDENDGDTAPHPLRRFYAFLYGSRADSCRSTYGFSGRRILQRVGDARPLWKMIRLLPLPTFRPPFSSSFSRPSFHVLPLLSSLSHPPLPPPSLSLYLFYSTQGRNPAPACGL